MKFFRIFEKNLLLVWRSKWAVAIILLAPLLMAALIGSAFSASHAYFVSVGVYEQEKTALGSSIKDSVAKDFKVSDYDSRNECIEGVKTGSVNVCLVLPENLAVERQEGTNEIEIYADNSRTNLVWAVLESLSTRISETSSNISVAMTAGLLSRMQDAKNEISQGGELVEQTNSLLEAAAADTEQLKANIAGLSANASVDRLMLSAITSSANSGFKEIGKLKESVDELIAGSKQELDDLSELIYNSSLSLPQKDIIGGQIETVDGLLNDILDEAKKSQNSSSSEMNRLNSTIEQANSELEKIRTLISETTEFKLSGFTKLSAVDASIDNTASALSKLKTKLADIEANLGNANASASYIVTPIVKKVMSVSPTASQLRNIFPALLVIVVMFSSLVLSSMFAVAEKSSKAYFRNSITPTDELAFLAAGYAANIIVVALQLAVFVAVSVVFLNLGFAGVGKLVALLLAGASLFILLGMLIGELFVSQEGSIIASLSVGSLLLFFSNTIIPIESLPWLAREIANYNPFVLAESLLRKTLIHLIPFAQLANELFIIIVYCIAIFALLAIVAKFERIKALKGDSKPLGKEPARQGASR